MRYPCVLRYRMPQLRLTPLYNPDPPSKSPSSEGDFCRAPCALRVEPAGKRRLPGRSVERAYATRVSCGTECRNGENLGAPRQHTCATRVSCGTECRNYGLRRYTILTLPLNLPPRRETFVARLARSGWSRQSKCRMYKCDTGLTRRPLPLHLAKRRKGLRGRKPAARYFNRISSSRYPAPPIRSMTNST